MQMHAGWSYALTITPSDTASPVAANSPQIRAIYVGGTGDITLTTANSSTAVVFKAVPVGTILLVAAKLIKATGTTATLMIGLAP